MLRLRTAALEVDIDPARGAQITRLARAGHSNVLAWYDWASPLSAERGPSYGDDRLDWLSAYRGGWQEMFPNAGAACSLDGLPLPFHGEASSAAWEVLSSGPGEAVLRCAARLPLILERRVFLDRYRPVLRIEETVANVSQATVPYLWGHHPAFELPAGSRIDLGPQVRYAFAADPGDPAPASGSWPRGLDPGDELTDLSLVPSEPTTRVVHLSGADGWYGLRPPSGTGIACAWDREAFPFLWLWQHLAGEGFPAYGRGWITALEPVNASHGHGLARAVAKGEAATVPPGGCARAWITMSLFEAHEAPVTAVERDGTIRFGHPPAR